MVFTNCLFGVSVLTAILSGYPNSRELNGITN